MPVDLKPTQEMSEEAARGLEWRREYNRGGTAVGVARARDISNRVNLSEDTIQRMVSYFARHEVDKQAEGFNPGEEGYPSAGRIAWALWGGDPGQSWAKQKLKQLEKTNMITIENKTSKLKLDKVVQPESIQELLDELSFLYGNTAVGNYKVGEIVASIENAVEELEIEIHSPGGSVMDGYRLFNAIKELRERGVYVTAKINTLAASMASVIAMAADKITIASNGRMMIHDASSYIGGNSEKLRKMADELDQISDEIANIYSERTGLSAEEIRTMMKSETWIPADKAVELKFADEIFDKKSKVMDFLTNFFNKFKGESSEQVESINVDLENTEAMLEQITAEFENRGVALQNAITELNEYKLKVENFDNKISELNNQLVEKDTLIVEKDTEISNLKEEVEQALKTAHNKAVEIVAGIGHEPLSVDPAEKAKGSLTREDINKLPTPEARMEARKKNWKKLNR